MIEVGRVHFIPKIILNVQTTQHHTTMEKRILLEKRGRPDDQITELILDNCRSTYIDGLTDSFTALETLSLINVGLVSLKNFPKLSNLRKLELSDNRISNGLNNLTGSPKLTHLNLSGNRIKDFEELQPLKDLQNVEVLDLFNNQVTLIENYREKIFQLIPSLSYLDGFDKDFAEAPSDDEELAGSMTDEEEDSCEESDEVSLAYLYNEDLEEDQEDWKSVGSDYNNVDDEFDSDDEEGAADDGDDAGGEDGDGPDTDLEGDDDDDGDDEDGEDGEDGEEAAEGADAAAEVGAATVAATEAEAVSAGGEDESVAKADESESRGKKRKFEGTDSDG